MKNMIFQICIKHAYTLKAVIHAYTLKAVMSVDLKSDALSDIRYSSNI